MSREFIVASTPEKELAFKNIVYYSPQNKYLHNAKHVKIMNIIFIAQPNQNVKAMDHICLSSAQRRTLGNEIVNDVKVQVYKIDLPTPAELLEISFVVELPRDRRCNLKESEIINFLLAYYLQYPFNLNQEVLLTLFDNVVILLRVTNLVTTDTLVIENVNNAVATFGVLVAQTLIEITSDTTSRYLKLTKDVNHKKSKLFDPNFNFADMGIGGLDAEFAQLFRRAFASRIFPQAMIAKLATKHCRGLLLWGPPGTGKCWGTGTQLMLYSGESKAVENIVAGDQLMGDDPTPRTVLPHSVITGQGKMFRVETNIAGYGTWTCNEDHILVLKNTDWPKVIHDHAEWWMILCVTTSPGKDTNSMILEEHILMDGKQKRRFRDQEDAERYVTNMQKTYEPLVFECTVHDFLSMSSIMREKCQMFQPTSVTFQQNGLSLQQRLERLCNRSMTEEEVIKSASVIGTWFSDYDDDDEDLEILEEYGLWDKTYIPIWLLTDSILIRRALLGGIIDGDNVHFNKTTDEYHLYSNDQTYVNGVTHLCRGLGFSVKSVSTAFHIVISGHELSSLAPYISLDSKRCTTSTKNQSSNNGTRFHISVIGEGTYHGFSLDGNGRCLLSNFQVTHNTLIARQIGKMLSTREPKIVNGPEIMNKFVGASEENIRNLFADAKKDYEEKGDAADLHMIIFDEFDSIAKTRSSGDRSGVNDNVVNQLLSMIDGINSLNNVLVIGMTNRKDLIDPALLRPGRMEVHIEIGLPDEKGRLQILNIHTKQMRENGSLSNDVDLTHYASLTKNFSGSELEGLVRSATSFALSDAIEMTDGKLKVNARKQIIVTKEAFDKAMQEVLPAFGVDENELVCLHKPLYDYGSAYQNVLQTLNVFVNQVKQSTVVQVVPILLQGKTGTGKTSIAAKIALESAFPFVRLIRASQFIGLGDNSKCTSISKVFQDAYTSPLSCIVIDGLENLLEFMCQRFNNTILQTLIACISQPHPHPTRRLLILATTNDEEMISMLHLDRIFQLLQVPELQSMEEVNMVLAQMMSVVDTDQINEHLPLPISIKKLITIADCSHFTQVSDGQIEDWVARSKTFVLLNDAASDKFAEWKTQRAQERVETKIDF